MSSSSWWVKSPSSSVSSTPWMMIFAFVASFLWFSICSSTFSLRSSCLMFDRLRWLVFATSAKLFFDSACFWFCESFELIVSSSLVESFASRMENLDSIRSLNLFFSFVCSWHWETKSFTLQLNLLSFSFLALIMLSQASIYFRLSVQHLILSACSCNLLVRSLAGEQQLMQTYFR